MNNRLLAVWLLVFSSAAIADATVIDTTNVALVCPEGTRYEKKLVSANHEDYYYIEGCKSSEEKYKGGVVKTYRLDDTLDTIYKFRAGRTHGRHYDFYAVSFDIEGRSKAVEYYKDEKMIFSERLPGYWEAYAENLEKNSRFTITTPEISYHDKKLQVHYANLSTIHADQLMVDIEANRTYLVNEICSERNNSFMLHLAEDGVALEVIFSDAEGRLLLKQTISRKDCE